MDDIKERDSKNFMWSDTIWNGFLLTTACALWTVTSLRYPDLDGVAVYELQPELPNPKLTRTTLPSNSDDIFVASTKMLDYCIFPKVFASLADPANSATSTYITDHGFNTDTTTAGVLASYWAKYDIGAMKRYTAEYNLPYDGLVATSSKPAISSHYYPPVCRCINDVFKVYEFIPRADTNGADKAMGAINNCIASQHIIKRQTVIGDNTYANNDMKERKYISRHAVLFQLCFAFVLGVLYNNIDFKTEEKDAYKSWNTAYLIALGASFIILFFLNSLSTQSVPIHLGINFSCIIILPGMLTALIIELMWYYAAKQIDIGRQTFMHPAVFYLVMSALLTIACIENGVFTLSVLVTQIFQACILTMAYACTLFAMHGNIWKSSDSSRTGFFIVILLAGLVHIHHLIPFFPVNTGISIYLWLTPTIFGVICYAKVLFLDHFMGDEDNVKGNRYRITHSTHLFDLGYVFLVLAVVMHFVICWYNLSYGDPNATASTYNAGKLTKRLNFAFGEVNVIAPTDTPFYNTITATSNKDDFQNKYYVNP